jgi:hypothetical protein
VGSPSRLSTKRLCYREGTDGSEVETCAECVHAATQEKPEAKQQSRLPRPKRDTAAREGRRPWLLAHDKAELAKAITRGQ